MAFFLRRYIFFRDSLVLRLIKTAHTHRESVFRSPENQSPRVRVRALVRRYQQQWFPVQSAFCSLKTEGYMPIHIGREPFTPRKVQVKADFVLYMAKCPAFRHNSNDLRENTVICEHVGRSKHTSPHMRRTPTHETFLNAPAYRHSLAPASCTRT